MFGLALYRILRKMGDKIYVRCDLEGEQADMYRELHGRGYVLSVRDAVSKGLVKMYDEMLERDLKKSRVSAARRLEA